MTPLSRRVLPAGLMAAGLLLGVGLRAQVAAGSGSEIAEWEADGFLRCWETLGWAPVNRMRPPLGGWLLEVLGHALGLASVADVRQLAVALSVLPLVGALWLARSLARCLAWPAPARGWTLACLVTWLWAVSPGLLACAASPTADGLTGLGLCVAAAGATCLAATPGAAGARRIGSALLLGAGVLLGVLAGGVPVALAIGAALLAFLLRLPPVRVAWWPAAAVLLACATAFWAQLGPGPERVPRGFEAAPAHAVLALFGQSDELELREPLDAARRAARARETALTVARQAGLADCTRALAVRLADDLLAPARFGARDGSAWWLGVGDVWLRGALALLAFAGVLRACGPRGGRLGALAPVAGGLVLLVGLAAAATHPFALAPLDAVLVGAAPVGALALLAPDTRAGGAQGGAQGSGRRRAAWLLVALLPLVPAVLVARRDGAPSPWVLRLGQGWHQGAGLVALLVDGGPPPGVAGGARELQAALAYSDHETPFLRWPEAAERHALRASQALPTDDKVVAALATAEVEQLRFERAHELADSLRDDSGLPTPDGRVLSAWIREEERRWRAERYR
jgi:hypothetical protein